MCNLYTWKMTAEEMRALKLHFQFNKDENDADRYADRERMIAMGYGG